MSIVYPITFNKNSGTPTPYIPPVGNLVSDFNPALDAFSDAGSTLCVDGDGVYEWHDQQTTAYFEQTTGSRQPTWRDGVTTPGSNGKAFVDFDGSNDRGIVENSSTLWQDDDLSIYIVQDVTSTGSGDIILGKHTDYYYDDGWTIAMASANTRTYVGTGCFADCNETTGTNGTLNADIRAVRFKSSAVTYQHNQKVNLTAEEAGSVDSFSGGFDTPTKDAIMGASYDSGGAPGSFNYDGKIYRILIYNTYHSDIVRDAIITGLSTIYGITV